MTINTDAILITDGDRQQVRDLIQWLKTNRPDLMEKARNPDILQQEQDHAQTFRGKIEQLQKLVPGFTYVHPDSLHGHYHVTPDLKKSAKATAVVMTTSNWIDTVGNLPVFFFAFKSLFFLPALGMAVLLSIPVLASSNALSTAVAHGHKGRWKLAIAALVFGLIPLNILQTVTTGIGMEVINNQSALAQVAAGDALDNIVQAKQESLQFEEANLHPDIARCEQGRQELETMPRTNAMEEKTFQSRYVRLYGTFSSQSQPMTVPIEQLPLCVRANRIQAEQQDRLQQLGQQVQDFKLERQTLGNDLMFLKQMAPQQYEKTFVEVRPFWGLGGSEPTVEVRNGLELVSLGINSFQTKFATGQWDQLGISLFFVGISAITSAASVAMGISFPLGKDTQRSYDESHKEKVNRFFQRARMTLTQMHDEQQQELLEPGADDDNLLEDDYEFGRYN
jgi:hypothetical protein